MELREKLCSLRKENGISQLEIAEKLEVSRQTISRWETGTSVPTTENLMRLSTLYSVSLDELVKEDWTPPEPGKQAEPEPIEPEPLVWGLPKPERRKLLRWPALKAVILAVVLAAGIAIGIWFSHRKDGNVISTADMEGEVIDFSMVTEAYPLLPPTE